MESIQTQLTSWEKEIYTKSFSLVQQAVADVRHERDVLKQKYCTDHFGISVNTLKAWVAQGCPEIRLATGTPMYSKSAIENWLRSQQK